MFTELIADGSLAALLDSLGDLLTIIYGGATVLILTIAGTARFAAVPLLEAVARLRRNHELP